MADWGILGSRMDVQECAPITSSKTVQHSKHEQASSCGAVAVRQHTGRLGIDKSSLQRSTHQWSAPCCSPPAGSCRLARAGRATGVYLDGGRLGMDSSQPGRLGSSSG